MKNEKSKKQAKEILPPYQKRVSESGTDKQRKASAASLLRIVEEAKAKLLAYKGSFDELVAVQTSDKKFRELKKPGSSEDQENGRCEAFTAVRSRFLRRLSFEAFVL